MGFWGTVITIRNPTETGSLEAARIFTVLSSPMRLPLLALDAWQLRPQPVPVYTQNSAHLKARVEIPNFICPVPTIDNHAKPTQTLYHLQALSSPERPQLGAKKREKAEITIVTLLITLLTKSRDPPRGARTLRGRGPHCLAEILGRGFQSPGSQDWVKRSVGFLKGIYSEPQKVGTWL